MSRRLNFVNDIRKQLWGNAMPLPTLTVCIQMQAVLAGCVPVVISDNVLEAFEPLLDWNTFGVRLAEAAIPTLHQVLDAISPQANCGWLVGLGTKEMSRSNGWCYKCEHAS